MQEKSCESYRKGYFEHNGNWINMSNFSSFLIETFSLEEIPEDRKDTIVRTMYLHTKNRTFDVFGKGKEAKIRGFNVLYKLAPFPPKKPDPEDKAEVIRKFLDKAIGPVTFVSKFIPDPNIYIKDGIFRREYITAPVIHKGEYFALLKGEKGTNILFCDILEMIIRLFYPCKVDCRDKKFFYDEKSGIRIFLLYKEENIDEINFITQYLTDLKIIIDECGQ